MMKARGRKYYGMTIRLMRAVRMKVYEEITETKEVVTKNHVETTCDMCGTTISKNGYPVSKGHGLAGTSLDGYKNTNTYDIRVEANFGDNWPEGGSGIEFDLDICAGCFATKILSLTEVEGKEYDW